MGCSHTDLNFLVSPDSLHQQVGLVKEGSQARTQALHRQKDRREEGLGSFVLQGGFMRWYPCLTLVHPFARWGQPERRWWKQMASPRQRLRVVSAGNRLIEVVRVESGRTQWSSLALICSNVARHTLNIPGKLGDSS